MSILFVCLVTEIVITCGTMMTPDVPRPSHEEEPKITTIRSGVYTGSFVLTNDIIEHEWQAKTKSGKPLTGEDILKRVGSTHRYVATPEETPFRMGAEAAQQALHGSNDVDLILVSTSFPTGEDLAGKFRDEFDITQAKTAINIHRACSGFASGLTYLHEHDEEYNGANVLFITTEKYHPYLHDLRDPQTPFLDASLAQTIFSDGATATVFQYGKDIKVHAAQDTIFPKEIAEFIRMPIDWDLMRGVCLPHPYIPYPPSGRFEQDGVDVFKFMRNSLKKIVDDVRDEYSQKMNERGIAISPIFMTLPHQGSRHMTEEGVAKTLQGEYGEVIRDYSEGNFSSGSIPKEMAKLIRSGDLKSGATVLMAGFGAGGMASNVIAQFGL